MIMKKKLSIIVPVYNAEKYLEEALWSVLRQTYASLEVICVNDGSTDSSREIIERIAREDKRLVVINKENTGVSDSRNIGLKMANGEYVGFLDADDCAIDCMYEKMICALEENDADICVCMFLGQKKRFKGQLILDNKQAIYEMNYGKYFMGHLPNKIFKTELWREVEFNKNIKIWEDFLCLHYVFDNSKKVVVIDEPLYYYRPNHNSAMLSSFKMSYLTVLDASSGIVDFIKEKYPEIIDVAMRNRTYSFYDVCERIILSCNPELKPLLKKNLKEYRKLFRFHYLFGRGITFFILRISLYFNVFLYKFVRKILVFLHR